MDIKKVPINKSWPYFKKCLPFIKPYLGRLLIGSVLSFFQNITFLLRVIIFIVIIDYIIPRGSDANRLLILVMAGYFGIMVVNSIIGAINTYIFSYITNHIFHDFRTKIFRHIQRLPISYFVSRNTGAIMSRITNDVRAMSNIFSRNFISFINTILHLFAIVLLMYIIHPKITLLTITTLPFLSLPFFFMKK